MESINIYLTTDDVLKFTKYFSENKEMILERVKTPNLYIMGDNISVCALKELNALKIPYQLTPASFESKRENEIFLLGTLSNSNLSLICFSSLEEKVFKAANDYFEVADWNTYFKQKRTVKSKDSSSEKVTEKKTSKTEEIKKVETKEDNTPTASEKKETTRGRGKKQADISELINKSKKIPTDKKIRLTTPGSLSMIKDAIKTSDNENTFLFQMKLNFGPEIGEMCANALFPYLQQLKDSL